MSARTMRNGDLSARWAFTSRRVPGSVKGTLASVFV
jgi:hypothetical protein